MEPQPQPQPEPEPEPEPVRNPRPDAPAWTTSHTAAVLHCSQDAAKKAEEIIGDMVRTLASASAAIEPGRSLLPSFVT